MQKRTKLLLSLVLGVSIVSLSISGCRLSPGKELTFTSIWEGDYGGYTDNASSIVVINQKPSSPVYGIQDKVTTQSGQPISGQTAIEATDYSQSFAIIAFYGWRGYYDPRIEIRKIRQNKNIIYVVAHFQDVIFDPEHAVQPGISSHYQIVEVDKDQLTQFGELTFILQDESGAERARNTFTVSR